MNLSQFLILIATAFLVSSCPSKATAQIAPTYTSVFDDATLNSSVFHHLNEMHWFVPAGADQYSIDRYERPTTQSYKFTRSTFATDGGSYWETLDIKSCAYGFDEQFLYLRIQMVGEMRRDSDGNIEREGLIHEYGFRLNTDPSGAYGYMFRSEEPVKAGSSFQTSKIFGYHDADGDANRDGDGYETDLVSDGEHKESGKIVCYSRIDPNNPSAVEFALKYSDIGVNPATISSVVFEANKGIKGPSNYPWNMKYSPSEAGSPNSGASYQSEFGTSGLGNIYEVDTLKGIPGTGSNEKLTIPPTGKIKIPYKVYRRGTMVEVGFDIRYRTE